MADADRQRLDKWLFFARIVKSRSLAAKLVQSGVVRVNRVKTEQPSHLVKPGDVLTIALRRQVVIYRVAKPGVRRGPADEARVLYEDITPTPAEPLSIPPAAFRDPGAGRPTKKERRSTDRLRDGRD
jgi:ribosome-associated heat shock protein Hsp15